MWRYNYTFTPEDEAYLMHYGVKGMKWDLEKRKKKFTNDLRRQANTVRRNAKRTTRKLKKAANLTKDLGKAMARGYITGAKKSAKKFKSDFKKGYTQAYYKAKLESSQRKRNKDLKRGKKKTGRPQKKRVAGQNRWPLSDPPTVGAPFAMTKKKKKAGPRKRYFDKGSR